MTKMTKINTILLLFIFAFFKVSYSFQRICYFKVDDKLNVSSVDGSLCTHLIVGFAIINNGKIVPTQPQDVEVYRNAVQLKKVLPQLKVMLSVGGGGGDMGFHEACGSSLNRTRFTFSALELMYQYGFDGLDIDWEFPVWNTSYYEDKQLFTTLLKNLHQVFSYEGNRSSNRKKLLLSVAVSAAYSIINVSYNVTEIEKYVDFINLMTYDFHIFSPYWPFTGFNAPLYKRQKEVYFLQYLNTNWSANYWVDLGMQKDKIMVGIPTYGRGFQLADANHTGPDSAAVSSNQDFTFSQVCELLSNRSTHRQFDNEAKVPYLYNGLLWISYDDVQSVELKANWIKDNNYGGSMTFSLNADDFNHRCDKNSKFVLHSVIKRILGN